MSRKKVSKDNFTGAQFQALCTLKGMTARKMAATIGVGREYIYTMFKKAHIPDHIMYNLYKSGVLAVGETVIGPDEKGKFSIQSTVINSQPEQPPKTEDKKTEEKSLHFPSTSGLTSADFLKMLEDAKRREDRLFEIIETLTKDAGALRALLKKQFGIEA